MNIEEIVEMECPRYGKKLVWNGTKQAIVHLHSYPETRMKYFDLDDDSIDDELEKMNRDYENYLRAYYSKREEIQ